MSLASRVVIKALKAAGFVVVGQKGSHVQFKHPERKGRATVPAPEAGSADWNGKKH